MKEIKYDNNLYLLPQTHGCACIVTTNGMLRSDGNAVMGAGIAKYCRDHFHGVDRDLGEKLKKNGNHVYYLGAWSLTVEQQAFLLFSFPTKDDWKDKSKPDLIRRSCKELVKALMPLEYVKDVYLPCPGCANGGLDYWKDVRPILLEELDDRFTVAVPAPIMALKPYEKPDTGNSMNDLFTGYAQFYEKAPYLLAAKSSREFCRILGQLAAIDRRSTVLFLEKHRDEINPEFAEDALEQIKADIFAKPGT